MPEIISYKEAKAKGLKRYFTGKPCKRGHVSERQTSNSTCLQCLVQKNEENPQIRRDHYKKWDSEHREFRNEARIKIYWSDPEKHRETSRNYRKKNPDKVKEMHKSWSEKNPFDSRIRTAKRVARKMNAEGFYKVEDIEKLFSLQKGKCVYCFKSIKKSFQVDHVVPLARGGSNWPSNLVLACKPCNNKKHAIDPFVFARRLGRLL